MIVYLHGFNSSPASHKAMRTKAYMEARAMAQQFACPALPVFADEAVRAIEAELARRDPARVTFIGSSLGGFYATWFAERHGARAVLVNPAITPHVGLEAYLGAQKNLHTGEPYQLTRAHLDAWRRLAVERVDPERYLLLLETGDEVLDWREAASRYAGARMVIRQGGDHMMQSYAEHLPRILRFAGLADTR